MCTSSAERTTGKKVRGGGWHQPGAGSPLQRGTRAQGNRCYPNHCLGRDLLEHCHISRQNNRNLLPAGSKHDLQNYVCSSTWYFPVLVIHLFIFRRGVPSVQENKTKENNSIIILGSYYSSYYSQNHISFLLFSSIGFCHRLFRERVEQGKQDKIRCFIDTHIIYSGCACNCSCFIFILNLVNQIHTEFNYLNFQGVMLKSRVWPHMLKNTEIHMCRRKEKLNSNFHNKKKNPVQAWFTSVFICWNVSYCTRLHMLAH